MTLRTADLYKQHNRLIELKRETYDKLYKRCLNQIKLTADTGELICFFTVPKCLFGSSWPLINVQPCATYIINKLTKSNKNIKATFIEPNIIFIDWRRKCDLYLN